RECGGGEPYPPKLMASGNQIHLTCDATSSRFVPNKGYRLVRDNVTQVVIDAVDINECAETPDICCANESKCKGPNCVKCFNLPGSYACQSESIVCDAASLDKNTCKCQGLACTRNTAWYAGCDGNPTKIKGLDKEKRVCTRILNQQTSKFESFDNEHALFEYAVKGKCDCC
ncbi:hypothetical protein PENTCL1PPCAC_15428, partial [Pristionchus entomophagus]